MDRKKLRNQVYLHFGSDPSVFSPVEEHVIDYVADALRLFGKSIRVKPLRQAVKADVVRSFGWVAYIVWAWRIARLISFIIDRWRETPAVTVTAKGPAP